MVSLHSCWKSTIGDFSIIQKKDVATKLHASSSTELKLQKWRMKCQPAQCLVAFLPLHERALESFSFVIITIMSLTTAADPKRGSRESVWGISVIVKSWGYHYQQHPLIAHSWLTLSSPTAYSLPPKNILSSSHLSFYSSGGDNFRVIHCPWIGWFSVNW